MTTTVARPGRLTRLVVPAWSGLLAVVVLGPALGRGFLLTYDMVFVPRQSLLPESVGLAQGPPRAVPVDAMVGIATTVVPGALLQKAALLLALTMAGVGAARLTPTDRLSTRLVAASFFVWNPYVAERLLIGHWTLLLAYAALPWALRAALDLRRGRSSALGPLLLAVAVGALSPSGGLLVAGAVAVVLGWPGAVPAGRARLTVMGAAVVLNAPWWVPALVNGSTRASDPDGVDAFAARAETVLGVPGSLLGLGGIWNAEVVPGSRTMGVAVIGTLVVVLLTGLGFPSLVRRWGARNTTALAAVAVLSFIVAAAGATPGVRELLRWAVSEVPGAGLLRDGHRYLAPLAVFEAVGVACGVERLAGWVRSAGGVRVVVAVGVVLPVLVLPDLAWGAAGRLRPVAYPDDWDTVRATLSDDARPGDVVSLPWATYRSYPWNDDRTVLDPAPRYLPRTTVVDRDLRVGDQVVAGEDDHAQAVAARLADADADGLRRLGVGWLLVQKDTPGAVPDDLVAEAELAVDGSHLALYRLPGPVTTVGPTASDVAAVLVADILAATVVLLAAVRTARDRGVPG